MMVPLNGLVFCYYHYYYYFFKHLLGSKWGKMFICHSDVPERNGGHGFLYGTRTPRVPERVVLYGESSDVEAAVVVS